MDEEVARSVGDVSFACDVARLVGGAVWDGPGDERCHGVVEVVLRDGGGGGALYAAALLPEGYVVAARGRDGRFSRAPGAVLRESLHGLLVRERPAYAAAFAEELRRRLEAVAAGRGAEGGGAG